MPNEQMTEEDIKLRYITPAIESSGWKREHIRMEQRVKFTDGKILLNGNMVRRGAPKRADYVLSVDRTTPLAIVEAKNIQHSVSHGLQQAKEYAKQLDIPFAYSSNGKGFAEYDFLTGKERVFSMEQFPSPDELLERYKREAHDGEGLSEEETRVQQQPFYSGQNTYPPRYYQRIAINRTLSAIARGQNRLLLVMATGTGKTYTAFQIIYRLLKSGMKGKILYLADRNILVDQSIQQDFAPLEKVCHKIKVANANPAILKSYQVYFALYQQLVGDDDKEHYSELFKPDYFDLIIVDECHRGSAKEESRWRRILEYFDSATQIGMTATPKETRYQSSLNYFGEPVYTYSLREGIEDGFLAPFRVINVKTNIGDGWRPFAGQKDINGVEIEDRIYNNSDYDYNIIIEDRIRQVARQITEYLKSTDRMAKTIVFCANEDHAERMRSALTNENADMCRQNPDYVVRITGSDEYGKGKLDYFISVSSPYPVIATTSKLLSTGVDCKMVKLIVLDQQIGSMTEFKQIIGRGTRLREQDGKTHFVVMDFRNVSRLFADPEWDGPIEPDPDFKPGGNDKTLPKPTDGGEKPETRTKCIVGEDGCRVEITQRVVSYYDAAGKLLRTENIIDYTKRNIHEQFADLSQFITRWRESDNKSEILQLLHECNIDLKLLKYQEGMEDVDDFDFICHIAYGQKPLTRRERAERVKKHDLFSRYGEQARRVLEALLDKYMNEGITEIENRQVLSLPQFKPLGRPAYIISRVFGGETQYNSAIRELENLLYEVA